MKSVLILLVMPLLLLAQQKKDSIRVFYLGGQSNMEGFGYVKGLPDSLKKNKNVFIYQGNPVGDNDKTGGLGKWDLLQAGHGTGFSSDGKTNVLSDRFGVELSLAKRLQELYPNQKVLAIFQPHLFSRTKDFADGFAESLAQFDELLLMDIYPARELPMEGITSEWLLSMVKNDNKKLVRKSELIDEILNSTATIIVTIGAGDIGEMVPKIKSELLLANK